MVCSGGGIASIFHAGIISGHKAPEKRTRRIGLKDARQILRTMIYALPKDIIDWYGPDALFHLPVYFLHLRANNVSSGRHNGRGNSLNDSPQLAEWRSKSAPL